MDSNYKVPLNIRCFRDVNVEKNLQLTIKPEIVYFCVIAYHIV